MKEATSKRERVLSLFKRKTTSAATGIPGGLCQNCSTIFSNVYNLHALLSPQGLVFKSWTSIQESKELGCRLCSMIVRHGSVPPHFRQAAPLLLHAECSDEALLADIPDYPAKILSVRDISVWNPASGSGLPSFLSLYTASSYRSAHNLTCPPFPYDFSDERNVQEALWRMKECCTSHELCGQSVPTQLPSRVIDVEGSNESQVVKIHHSSPGEQSVYAALSYCWGRVSQRTSTVASAGELENGVPLSSLSKSVQDAVKVTRALRIRYLWVDALCIIQDSPGDIAHEIGTMGSIYRNAALTIVAAHSDSAHLGFLGTNAPYEGCELPFLLPDGTVDTILAVSGGIGPRIPPLPLDTRAWSMQEQMLSARQLVFNLNGIGWKCQTYDFTPLFSSPFDKFTSATTFEVPRLPASAFTRRNITDTNPLARQQEIWESIINEYCKRNLTYFEDRLPALAGIAAQLQDVWNDTYVAGLWMNCLVTHLAWQIIGSISTPLAKQKLPYIAPSWSWMSFPQEIRFSGITNITATVQGFYIEPQDRNAPLGKIKSGYINLLAKANTQSVKARFPEMDRERFWLDDGGRKLAPDTLYLKLGDIGTFSTKYDALGLLITPVGDGTYRRVGMFEWRESALFDNVLSKVFRLV